MPLTSAGHLNSVMPTMLRVLESTGLPVTTSDGASTAYTRHQLGVAKSHVNDAACLDFPTQVQNLDIPVTVLRRQRRHSRQSINCNSHGSPASKAFPDYCRLPRSTQAYITPPSHSVGRRRINGIGTGDIVRIMRHSGQTFTGRAIEDIKAQRVKIRRKGHQPERVSATASKTALTAHRSRWTVSFRQDATHQKTQQETSPPFPSAKDA